MPRKFNKKMHTTHKHRYLRGSAIAYVHGRQQTDIIREIIQNKKFLSDYLNSLEAQNTELLLLLLALLSLLMVLFIGERQR